ncbi:MAG TPA: ABC transporter ATP-binding protein [Candidatus Eremiobacteraceae bacterium]|nr:ABC transporter ATP-binding protein [Candidatus Eremiobacteraceae bacterium]
MRTDALTKYYGSVAALTGLTMTVPRGEIFGFLGPNGAGKTTAVKLLLGLARPTSGHARVLGGPPDDLEMRRRIGYLPELFRYQDWLTAREVLDLHCALAGVASRQRRSSVDESLELVGLTARGRDRVGTFSKGMQQRLGLAVALVAEPDVVFLDEPTSALDPVGRRDVREVLRALKSRGSTVFLNSHMLSEVEQVCDRVAVVDHGRVIALGTLAELIGGPKRVRIDLDAASIAFSAAASRFGVLEDGAGTSIIVGGVEAGSIPDLVAALVATGARIRSVAPESQTLEDRFLSLLRIPNDADPDLR